MEWKDFPAREEPVHLARYLRLVTRWWWLLPLGALIGGGSAPGIRRAVTPAHPARAPPPLRPGGLGSRTEAAVVPDPPLLRLSVEQEEPGQARLLANAVAQ